MKTSQKSKKSIDLGSYATGEVGGFAAQLFRIAAHNPLRPIVARLPANGMPIIKELYQGKAPEIARVEEPVIVRREVSQDRGLVAFSGGKDSTAVAIKMVQQGISTELFNVSGINPAYPEEIKAARSVAGELGVKMSVLSVKLGPQAWVENPAKNQVILGLMIDYGTRIGAGSYAMGIMTTEEAAEVSFDYGYSDAIEMHRAGAETFEGMVPGIKVHTELLKNEIDSYRTILGFNPGLLAKIQSRMTPIRYRGVHHKNNRAKFGATILPNRCGSCYKCAQEVLILKDLGHLTPGTALVGHAVETLAKAAPKLIGSHAKAMSRQEIINYFTKE